jgi:SAM-dependent methyltransferase
LDLADGSLGGIVAFYSIIHTPPELLPAVLVEFRRVLCPGGYLLLAFQVGDEPLRISEPGGYPVSLDFNRWLPDHVTNLLDVAGLAVQAQLLREPTETEAGQQAFLLARGTQKRADVV